MGFAFSSGGGGDPDKRGSSNWAVKQWITFNLGGDAPDYGDGAKGNVNYVGEYLRSYSTVIARFVTDLNGRKVVLLTDAKMSPTTSAHQRCVERMCEHRVELFSVRYLGSGGWFGDWRDFDDLGTAHGANVQEMTKLWVRQRDDCIRRFKHDLPHEIHHWARECYTVERAEANIRGLVRWAEGYGRRFIAKNYHCSDGLESDIAFMKSERARKLVAYQQPKAVEARKRAEGRRMLRKLFIDPYKEEQ